MKNIKILERIKDPDMRDLADSLIRDAREKKRRLKIRQASLRWSHDHCFSESRRGPILPNGMKCIRWHFYQQALSNHRSACDRARKFIARVVNERDYLKDPNSGFDQMVHIDYAKLWAKVPFWDRAEGGKLLSFPCDDASGILEMLVGPDGDIHVGIVPHPRAKECGHVGHPAIRVRTWSGGGRSQRMHQAMLLAMLAISEDCPNAVAELWPETKKGHGQEKEG
jgi:hypothetical protein